MTPATIIDESYSYDIWRPQGGILHGLNDELGPWNSCRNDKFSFQRLGGEKGGTAKLETLDLVRDILDVVEDKKGSDIVVLDIRGISLLADYFIISTVESTRQLGAIVDSVVPEMKKQGLLPLGGVEGTLDSGWVLIDFGAIVLHLFSPEQRSFYALEKLWKDAKVVVRIQ